MKTSIFLIWEGSNPPKLTEKAFEEMGDSMKGNLPTIRVRKFTGVAGLNFTGFKWVAVDEESQLALLALRETRWALYVEINEVPLEMEEFELPDPIAPEAPEEEEVVEQMKPTDAEETEKNPESSGETNPVPCKFGLAQKLGVDPAKIREQIKNLGKGEIKVARPHPTKKSSASRSRPVVSSFPSPPLCADDFFTRSVEVWTPKW